MEAVSKLLVYETTNVEETIKLGEIVGRKCVGNEVFALMGDLGTGKTQFAKGVAKGLGVPENEVSSPTFVISQLHTKGRLPFIHIDLYRLPSEAELDDLGWFDFVRMGGVILVEWAEKIKHLLSPEDTVFITLDYSGDEKRVLKISFMERFGYLFSGI